MPLYDYGCNQCGNTFEKNMKMVDIEVPTTEPCPTCSNIGCIENYLSSAPSIGDPIKLGITRPPDAFLHGVLGRMEQSIPDGSIIRDASGKMVLDHEGKPKKKFVNFNKARFQPGRLI